MLETAPTQFIEAGGITFAYRSFGAQTGTPLIFLQHFSGNMDSWDPAVVNALAGDRPVVVFDNTGVGKSSGQTPDNVPQMTIDAGHFIAALGLVRKPSVCGGDRKNVSRHFKYLISFTFLDSQKVHEIFAGADAVRSE
jgi:pimeloyl-ACP methyl ester carboxylesterase